jgi:hypothetical protein
MKTQTTLALKGKKIVEKTRKLEGYEARSIARLPFVVLGQSGFGKLQEGLTGFPSRVQGRNKRRRTNSGLGIDSEERKKRRESKRGMMTT